MNFTIHDEIDCLQQSLEKNPKTEHEKYYNKKILSLISKIKAMHTEEKTVFATNKKHAEQQINRYMAFKGFYTYDKKFLYNNWTAYHFEIYPIARVDNRALFTHKK